MDNVKGNEFKQKECNEALSKVSRDDCWLETTGYHKVLSHHSVQKSVGNHFRANRLKYCEMSLVPEGFHLAYTKLPRSRIILFT